MPPAVHRFAAVRGYLNTARPSRQMVASASSSQDQSAEQYAKRPAKVAIIGAGLAGSACAGILSERGADASIFDMGFRGPGSHKGHSPLPFTISTDVHMCVNVLSRLRAGGRASTRTYDMLQFDHGCQFVAASGRTNQLEKQLSATGALKPWVARLGAIDAPSGAVLSQQQVRAEQLSNDFCRWNSLLVGVPGMNAVCSQLTAREHVRSFWRHKVTGIERAQDGTWSVNAMHKMPHETPDEPVTYPGFKWLVLADRLLIKKGSPCVIELGAAESSPIISTLRKLESQPTITLMLAYPSDSPLKDTPLDAIAVQGSSAIKWISNDSSKPGRPRDSGHTCWTVLSTPRWAESALSSESDRSPTPTPATGDSSSPEVPRYASKLLQEFEGLMQQVLGKQLPQPVFLEAQRWGSAFKAEALNEGCLVDEELGLLACGDFCVEASAHGALASGVHAAETLQRFIDARA